MSRYDPKPKMKWVEKQWELREDEEKAILEYKERYGENFKILQGENSAGLTGNFLINDRYWYYARKQKFRIAGKGTCYQVSGLRELLSRYVVYRV